MPTIKPLRLKRTERLLYDPERDGVTFSLLSTFLDCREKTRLYLEGWSGTIVPFALLFGGLAHKILQKVYTAHQADRTWRPTQTWIIRQLEQLRQTWVSQHLRPHPKAIDALEEAIMKAGVLLPAYFQYWKEDFTTVQWMEVEETFQLPWTVTTRQGQQLRTFLRGRLDGAYRLPGAKIAKLAAAPRLLETKSRTFVDETELMDTMPHERQTNTYLSVLRKKTGLTPVTVLLNIIRKPALRQKQKETWAQFEKRIGKDVQSRPDWYFIRMEMRVTAGDIDRSEEELNELISDFLLWRAGESGHYKNSNACVRPGYGPCPYLKVCGHQDYTGLEQRSVVFRELEDV